MTDKVIIHQGESGASSVDGINGLGVSDVSIQKLETPLYNALMTNKLSKVGNIDWERGSLASHNNRHHKNVWVRSSTTTNFIEHSNDFAEWADLFGRWSIVAGTTDPFGGSDATVINLDVDTEVLPGIPSLIETDHSVILPAGGVYTISFWIKLISGTTSALQIKSGSFLEDMVNATSEWQRVSKTVQSFFDVNKKLSIIPRGVAGVRVALYEVQIEDNNNPTPNIRTTGTTVTENFIGEIERESDKGWLIEGEKDNICQFSGNLSKWTLVNCTIDTFTGEDPFGVTGEKTRIVWATSPTVTLSIATIGMAASTAHTVSFWAYLTAGSTSELTVSLGGGTAVTFPNPSVTGFQRMSVECTSGAGADILISVTSTNLTASLNITGVQVETGELSGYNKTMDAATTRLADVVSTPYDFNMPNPSLPWSFIFEHQSVINSATKKIIFTNDQTGADEFSCYFQNGLINLKNGSVVSSIEAIAFSKIAITFSGTTLKIYNESALINTDTITPSSFIPATMYIGMDSLKANALNAHLSKYMFYDVELSANELIYLMGA